MSIDLSLFSAVDCTISDDGPGVVTLTSTAERCAASSADPPVIAAIQNGGYLVMDVENLTPYNVALGVAFWREADPDRSDMDPAMTFTLGTFPGLPARIALDLRQLDAQQLFLDRTPGKLKSMAYGAGMRLDEIERIDIGIVRSAPGSAVRFSSVRLSADEPEYPLPDRTLVDDLGQWSEREWPGKTANLAELTSYLRKETNEALAARKPGGPAADESPTSRWGGFARDRHEATGYFRTHHTGDRHILVDPDGYEFYSLGLDCVQETIDARVDGIEELFAWLPDVDGPLADTWIEGSLRFPNARSVDFLTANLRRALGEDWFGRWAALTESRMRQWGFNTIGNWASTRFVDFSSLAYVVPLKGEATTEAKIFRDFPDVFSPEYVRSSEAHAAQLSAFEGDARLLGYFIMNEPHWAFVNDLNIAEKLVSNPSDLASKEHLIGFLSERYAGEARKLASAWNLEHLRSFSDLRRPIEDAASLSKTASRDLDEFNTILIRKFAKEPCEAARRADPHHLNLGMRYAWISQAALYETGEYFDVFSINRYAPTARPEVDAIGERTGKPVMIGEFHHGGLDGGLPSNGIRGVRTQADRAMAYRFFVETTAASPYSVGVHYFTLNDQAILGRFDGENFQIGIVDICQRPYKEFADGVTITNGSLAGVIFGDRPPTDAYPKEMTVGF